MRGQHYFRLIYGSGRSYGLARTARAPRRLAASPTTTSDDDDDDDDDDSGARRREKECKVGGSWRTCSRPILSTIRRQAAEGDTLQHYKAIDAKGQRGSDRRRPNQWF